MSRTIHIDAGPRKRHATVDGVGISRGAYDALTLDAGDIITIADAHWSPSVASELAPSASLITAISEDIFEDPTVIMDEVIAFDASNAVNGSPWLWAAPVGDPSAATLVPADFAWAGTIDVSSDWGGGWRFELFYGSGFARLSDREDGAEIDAVVLPRTVDLSEALIALAARVNAHGALCTGNSRRFSMCPSCAQLGAGSPDLEDGEECWQIDLRVADSCDDGAKAGLLNALWIPCETHATEKMPYFGEHWSWSESGWSPTGRT